MSDSLGPPESHSLLQTSMALPTGRSTTIPGPTGTKVGHAAALAVTSLLSTDTHQPALHLCFGFCLARPTMGRQGLAPSFSLYGKKQTMNDLQCNGLSELGRYFPPILPSFLPSFIPSFFLPSFLPSLPLTRYILCRVSCKYRIIIDTRRAGTDHINRSWPRVTYSVNVLHVCNVLYVL